MDIYNFVAYRLYTVAAIIISICFDTDRKLHGSSESNETRIRAAAKYDLRECRGRGSSRGWYPGNSGYGRHRGSNVRVSS